MRLDVVAAIVRKDLRLFLSDRRSVIMSFVAPIAIASFFGLVFSGSGNRESRAARIAVRVVDLDQSAVSRAIVSALTAEPAFETRSDTVEEARTAVRTGKAVAAVILPMGFGPAAVRSFLASGTRPDLPLLYDPSHAMERGLVRGLLTEHVIQVVGAEAFGGTEGQRANQEMLERLRTDTGMDPATRAALTQMIESVQRLNQRSTPGSGRGAPALGVPCEFKEEAVTSRSGVAYNAFAHSFAGMGVQFLLFACIDLAIGMLLERQQGIWKRLRAAPLSRQTLLLGKTASGAAIALLTLWVSFGFGMIVFGIRLGSVAGFVAVSVACALMASTFGLLVAALGRTPGATRGMAILAVLLMVMLGGAWIPAFVFPAWLQKATLAVPARWAVDGLDAVSWRGASFVEALTPTAALLAFAAAFGLLAVYRFRWDAE